MLCSNLFVPVQLSPWHRWSSAGRETLSNRDNLMEP